MLAHGFRFPCRTALSGLSVLARCRRWTSTLPSEVAVLPKKGGVCTYYIHVDTSVYVYIYAYMCTCVYTYIYMCIHVDIYIYTCIHTHTHTRVSILGTVLVRILDAVASRWTFVPHDARNSPCHESASTDAFTGPLIWFGIVSHSLFEPYTRTSC